jgi:DNA-binding IscR family transcriptional regulator
MQLSTRARCAVMAMAELAWREPAGAAGPVTEPVTAPVTLAQTAASQQLSLGYLEQLFIGRASPPGPAGTP